MTDKQLEEAKQYASYSIKYGYSSEEDWKDLTYEEFIAKAKYFMDMGDDYVN